MEDLRAVFLAHYDRYPKSQIQDFVKLAYQSTFGPGHMISNPASARAYLQYETAVAPSTPWQTTLESIGSGFYRMHLGATRDYSVDAIAALFFLTAAVKTGSQEALIDKLRVIVQLSKEEKLPCDAEAWILAYRASGCPAIHHSKTYREAYAPAYRVVSESALRVLPMLREIDRLLRERDTVTVAIEGSSASGKSLLGKVIADAYDANLFHMDDFFLRPEQRTPERFAQPGGNIDYERFRREILVPLGQNVPFDYRVFDCSTMDFGGSVTVRPKKLRIVEGAYSRHPFFGDPYDLKIYLGVDPVTQSERIRARNGERMLKRFLSEWIPYENAYFAAYNVINSSDFVIL
ncbi:MAG: hypothetical protein VB111_00830 [Clostridiaceae bacterium]|nr:hypothetical protein [Clostridiaceae bacterium]